MLVSNRAALNGYVGDGCPLVGQLKQTVCFQSAVRSVGAACQEQVLCFPMTTYTILT